MKYLSNLQRNFLAFHRFWSYLILHLILCRSASFFCKVLIAQNVSWYLGLSWKTIINNWVAISLWTIMPHTCVIIVIRHGVCSYILILSWYGGFINVVIRAAWSLNLGNLIQLQESAKITLKLYGIYFIRVSETNIAIPLQKHIKNYEYAMGF